MNSNIPFEEPCENKSMSHRSAKRRHRRKQNKMDITTSVEIFDHSKMEIVEPFLEDQTMMELV